MCVYLEYQKNINQSRRLLQYFNDSACYIVLNDIAQSNGLHLTLGHLPLNTHVLNIEGPVDGLYCLHNLEGCIVLWNPALRGFKVLLSPHPHFLHHYGVAGCNIGFGIDPLTKEHKVVLFRYSSDVIAHFPAYENPIVTLYRLTANTWRLLYLGDLGLCNLKVGYGSYFNNGIYHWCVDQNVLAFNRKGDFSSDTRSIVVYEEHVPMVRNNALFVHVLLMLEEGIWIKQFSMGPSRAGQPNWVLEDRCFFLAVDDSGQYPPNHDSRLVLYDVDTQEIRNVGTRATWYAQACAYYESFVSFGRGSEYD